MKLYHGTRESVGRLALTEGLKPRSATGEEGNWEHTVGSSPNHVYLTTAYAGHFANAATPDGERWCVIEVETGRLDPRLFRPDEDWMEQGTRGGVAAEALEAIYPESVDVIHGTMEERTKFFRDRLDDCASFWKKSVNGLGSCVYQGEIPTDAITRVAMFEPRENMMAAQGIDPTITTMNYMVMGDQYRAITRWLVGRPMSLKKFQGFAWDMWRKMTPPDIRREGRRLLSDHVGLEVVYAEARGSRG